MGLSRRLAWLGVVMLSCLASALTGAAQEERSRYSVALWSRWETSFQAAGSTGLETQLSVECTAPSGQVRRVEGFWDGGRTWRVRFMPDELGTWRYRTASQPSVPGLDEQAGSFDCRRAGGEEHNALLKHGAIRIAANGTHLVHADGTPFFWLADTAWNGALLSEADDWEEFLADRVEKRFTAIQFVATHWRTAYTDREGEPAYTGRDPIQINPKFFQRLDERVEAINRRGLLAVPVVLWALGEPDHTPGKLPTDQAARLARYIVARYGAHHVVWFLGGDERYAERVDHWKTIGRETFGSMDHAPVALHPTGRSWPFDPFRDEKWYGLHVYQSGHRVDAENSRWLTMGPPAQKWRESPARPVINSEPPYEDHNNRVDNRGVRFTADDVRRASYWSLLVSPTAGVTYGAHGVWSWQEEPAEPLNHRGTGVAKTWREASQLPGSAQMKHLADLFQSIEWWRLRPDDALSLKGPPLLRSQPGENDPFAFIAAARTEEGDLAVVYLPKGGEVSLNLSVLQQDAQAEWFNPRNGERALAESTAQDAYRAADDNDWVLLLKSSKTKP